MIGWTSMNSKFVFSSLEESITMVKRLPSLSSELCTICASACGLDSAVSYRWLYRFRSRKQQRIQYSVSGKVVPKNRKAYATISKGVKKRSTFLVFTQLKKDDE